jgi:hypothetical protein
MLKKSSLKLLGQMEPNLAGSIYLAVLISCSPVRFLILLTVFELLPKTCNFTICSILSQNVPKFELYKHNDELFNIYYRIFYELLTFADFDRPCSCS